MYVRGAGSGVFGYSPRLGTNRASKGLMKVLEALFQILDFEVIVSSIKELIIH